MPTVSITVARDVTQAIKVPRAVFVPWPMGHHFGTPFDRELQRRVLFEAIDVLEVTEESGAIRDLPIKWVDARRSAKILSDQGMKL